MHDRLQIAALLLAHDTRHDIGVDDAVELALQNADVLLARHGAGDRGEPLYRWASVKLCGGPTYHGEAHEDVGGSIRFLELRPDGGRRRERLVGRAALYELTFADEQEVRALAVKEHAKGWIGQRGHVFEASPILGELCAGCGATLTQHEEHAQAEAAKVAKAAEGQRLEGVLAKVCGVPPGQLDYRLTDDDEFATVKVLRDGRWLELTDREREEAIAGGVPLAAEVDDDPPC